MNSNNKFKRLNSAISNKSFKSQNKQLKRTLTSRSTGKTTKTNYNRSISIALTRNKEKKVSFKTLKEKDEYDNIYLKDLISKKQREIKQLKDDLRIVYLQEKGEDYL